MRIRRPLALESPGSASLHVVGECNEYIPPEVCIFFFNAEDSIGEEVIELA